MPEVKKYDLVARLIAADKKFDHSPAVVGKSSMTFPGYINSTRTQMFTTHQNQFLNIANPDFPITFTGAEDVLGAKSTGYKEIKHTTRVIKKIEKYGDILDKPFKYYLFVYDEEKHQYDVIERKEVETLGEDFAFKYNNEVIDTVKENDILDKGDILYKSMSYDESMHYRYGINTTVGYVLDPWTSEDAAVIDDWFSEKASAYKDEVITFAWNNNEVPLNLYGDEYIYRPIPNIGDKCGPDICITRLIQKDRMFYDLIDSNLTDLKDGDRTFVCKGHNAVVIDYDIYINNEEFEDNDFNHQVLMYAESQEKFYTEIRDMCKTIKESGEKYTQAIKYLHKRSKEFLNKKKKWRNKNESCPGNVEIRATVMWLEPLGVGGKFTGRMGNKSVVSKVVPEEEMPVTENGIRVHVKLNLLAIMNRTTAFAIHELYESFVLQRLREQLKELDTYKKKEKLLFDVMKDLNEEEYKIQWEDTYSSLSKEEKKEYIDDAINNGIYINEIPIWDDNPIFFRLKALRDKYDWIKPYKMYQMKWGELYPTLTDMYVGTMYMFRLKQTSERGFSARATGAVNLKGLPERSYKNRNNTERVSDTAIRLGEFEFITLSAGMSPEEIMAFHALYRTSNQGREDLMRAAFKPDGKIDLKDKYDSVTGKLFAQLLKSLSLEIEISDGDAVTIKSMDDDTMRERHFKGETYFLTDYEWYLLTTRAEIEEKIVETYPLLNNAELEKKVDAEMDSICALTKKKKK